MKNTILSEKDIRIIEKVILRFGQIVSIDNLMEVFSDEYSKASAHNRIQFLSKAGWFLRIKRGLYLIISNLTSRSTNDTSLLLIAQAINNDSYISLQAALNHFQMFDQYSSSISVINKKISKTLNFVNNQIKFIKIDTKYYFGFEKTRVQGKVVQMATKEKALLDYLYLDNSFYSASLVLEKIRNHTDEINFEILRKSALKFNVSVQRKLGFLLDQLNLETNELLLNVSKHKGFSRLTKGSNKFNAKWRLYYDDRIIK